MQPTSAEDEEQKPEENKEAERLKSIREELRQKFSKKAVKKDNKKMEKIGPDSEYNLYL